MKHRNIQNFPDDASLAHTKCLISKKCYIQCCYCTVQETPYKYLTWIIFWETELLLSVFLVWIDKYITWNFNRTQNKLQTDQKKKKKNLSKQIPKNQNNSTWHQWFWASDHPCLFRSWTVFKLMWIKGEEYLYLKGVGI